MKPTRNQEGNLLKLGVCEQNLQTAGDNYRDVINSKNDLQSKLSSCEHNLNNARNAHQNAVNHLNNIKIENYYYYEEFLEKHSTRFLGFKGEPYYTTNYRLTFKELAYKNDLTAATQAVNHSQFTLNQATKARDDASSAFYKIDQNISLYKTQLDQASKAKDDALIAVNREINQVEQQISTTRIKIAEVNNQINVENNANQVAKNRLAQNQAVNDELAQQISQQHSAIMQALQATDTQQRAFILSELWGKNDRESSILVQAAQSIGFDANYLAEKAIEKNYAALFDFALANGADCSSYIVNNQSLLQRLIHQDNELFVQKILALKQNLGTTLVTAIDQQDALVLSKLLSGDSGKELLHERFSGYTLLQIAIAAQKEQAIDKILELDATCVNSLNSNGESALKVAARIANENIITKLIPHVNIALEVEQLGANADALFKAKLLENRDIETVVKLLKGEKLTFEQYVEEYNNASTALGGNFSDHVLNNNHYHDDAGEIPGLPVDLSGLGLSGNDNLE